MSDILKTLRISFSLKNTYRVNSIIYGLKQIPIVKKLIPESIYGVGGLKIFVNIISILWEFISAFAGKLMYLLFMVLIISSQYNTKNQPLVYLNILVFLTFIGAILNTYLFDPSKDKYYAIVLLRMNAKYYALVNYAYELFKTIVGFMVFGCIIGWLVGVPMYINILSPFFVAGCKLTVSGFNLWRNEKHDYYYNENKGEKLKVILVIVFLAAAYGLPLIGCEMPLALTVTIMVLAILTGIFSLKVITGFTKYRLVYARILKEADEQLEKVSNVELSSNRDLIELNSSDVYEQSVSKKEKKGFEYLNSIFIRRHRKILWKPAKLASVICLVLVLASIILMFIFDNLKVQMAELPLKYLSMSLFWMYFINRGQGFTKALFMNCDHSLLTYSFYRTPHAILELFKIRLREIIKINLLPAFILGTGLSVVLILSGVETNPVNYLIVFITFPAESIFFSVHYLIIYYLLQPYNAGTEVKSGMYKIITGLTYMICYFMLQVEVPVFVFGISTISFSVLYCIIACILVYKIAPRTFKIRA